MKTSTHACIQSLHSTEKKKKGVFIYILCFSFAWHDLKAAGVTGQDLACLRKKILNTPEGERTQAPCLHPSLLAPLPGVYSVHAMLNLVHVWEA